MRKGPLGLLWSLLGVGIGVLVFGAQPRVHALPEYSTRTGESCATCHVSPAGGGPRTARSALWIAQGRPDQVPQVPGTAEDENSALGDGEALYARLACASCHGDTGQGASGPALTSAGLKETEEVIRKGRGIMMAYAPDRLSDADLALLAEFVGSLATGNAQPADPAAPANRGPADITCSGLPAGATAAARAGASTSQGCGGN